MPRRLVSHVRLDALTERFDRIRQQASVDPSYGSAVVAQARASDTSAELDHVWGSREDLTDIPFVTIDPEGSRDLDQALYIEHAQPGWLVQYAIADVAAHVPPGGPLDHDTWQRIETVYCPDMRVGLHPPLLSEGFASLLPQQRTKAVVWTIQVGADGELRETSVRRAWVKSRKQWSYRALEAARGTEAVALKETMRALGDARRRLLRAAGAVTLPKPSQEVVLDGNRLSLEFRAGSGLEDDNAQISLLTGMTAAQMMIAAKVGVLRTMPPASQAALERLRRQAKALSVEWGADQDYADVLDTLDAGSPQSAAFLVAAVQLFRGARWEPFDARGLAPAILPLPQQVDHGALAAPYAHVTAPLRRLVDRYGTEVCLSHCAGVPVPDWVTEALPRLGAVMAAGVRRVSEVDRQCVDAVEAAVLASHVGETFVGVGLDQDTVQLAQPAVIARCSGEIDVGAFQSVRLDAAAVGEGVHFSVLLGDD